MKPAPGALAVLSCVLALALASVCAPAFAIYKCEADGAIFYSDEPCPAGKKLRVPGVPAGEAEAARQRTEQEKLMVRRMENERAKEEAREEKERQRAAHAAEAKRKKCSALGRRMRWAEEDAAAAVGRNRDKARLKARRVAEVYQEECGTRVGMSGR